MAGGRVRPRLVRHLSYIGPPQSLHSVHHKRDGRQHGGARSPYDRLSLLPLPKLLVVLREDLILSEAVVKINRKGKNQVR